MSHLPLRTRYRPDRAAHNLAAGVLAHIAFIGQLQLLHDADVDDRSKPSSQN